MSLRGASRWCHTRTSCIACLERRTKEGHAWALQQREAFEALKIALGGACWERAGRSCACTAVLGDGRRGGRGGGARRADEVAGDGEGRPKRGPRKHSRISEGVRSAMVRVWLLGLQFAGVRMHRRTRPQKFSQSRYSLRRQFTSLHSAPRSHSGGNQGDLPELARPLMEASRKRSCRRAPAAGVTLGARMTGSRADRRTDALDHRQTGA